MPIFRYSSDLLVTGTYHALNSSDRDILAQLIETTDFVALEGSKEANVAIELFGETEAQDNGVKTTASHAMFSSLYLTAANTPEEKGTFDPRDFWIPPNCHYEISDESRENVNEFAYCRSVADKKNKDCFRAGYSGSELVAKLDKLSCKQKMTALGNAFRSETEDQYFGGIVDRQREYHMMKEIQEKADGRINNLGRTGLLVVGTGHALNYYLRRPGPLKEHEEYTSGPITSSN